MSATGVTRRGPTGEIGRRWVTVPPSPSRTGRSLQIGRSTCTGRRSAFLGIWGRSPHSGAGQRRSKLARPGLNLSGRFYVPMCTVPAPSASSSRLEQQDQWTNSRGNSRIEGIDLPGDLAYLRTSYHHNGFSSLDRSRARRGFFLVQRSERELVRGLSHVFANIFSTYHGQSNVLG